VANITVEVQSPGLSVWGGANWGEGQFSQIDSTSFSVGQVLAFNNIGWGGHVWNSGSNWGDLNDTTFTAGSVSATFAIGNEEIETKTIVEVTGISLTSAVGNEDTEVLNNGWGLKHWGEFSWGLTGTLLATGSQANTSLGSITNVIDVTVETGSVSASSAIGSSALRVDADVTPASQLLTSSIGNEDTIGNAIIDATSLVATSSAGQSEVDPTFLIGEGWGRDTYGNLGWGVNYSVIGGGVNGIALTSSIGNEDAFTDFTAEVSGIQLQTSITPVGTSANSDNEIAHSFLIQGSVGDASITGHALVEPSGASAATAIGDAVGGTLQEVPVTGIQLTANIGNEDTSGNADVNATAIFLTSSAGQTDIKFAYDATGSQVTASAGQIPEVNGDALVQPTGIGLTSAVASPNIIAWAEVDVGTPVTWTEVDLAA